MAARTAKKKRTPSKSSARTRSKQSGKRPKAAPPVTWFFQEDALVIVTPDRLKDWEEKVAKESGAPVARAYRHVLATSGTCTVSFSGPSGRTWDDSRTD